MTFDPGTQSAQACYTKAICSGIRHWLSTPHHTISPLIFEGMCFCKCKTRQSWLHSNTNIDVSSSMTAGYKKLCRLPNAEIWLFPKVTPVFVESAMNYSPLNQDRKDAVRLQMGCTAGVTGIRECHKSPPRLRRRYESCVGGLHGAQLHGSPYSLGFVARWNS